MTKKTSMKNLYCAENKITKILLITIEKQIKLTILFFLMMLKMINATRLIISEILIADFIPFKKSQFLI